MSRRLSTHLTPHGLNAPMWTCSPPGIRVSHPHFLCSRTWSKRATGPWSFMVLQISFWSLKGEFSRFVDLMDPYVRPFRTRILIQKYVESLTFILFITHIICYSSAWHVRLQMFVTEVLSIHDQLGAGNGKQGFQTPIANDSFLIDGVGALGTAHSERGLTYLEVQLSGHMCVHPILLSKYHPELTDTFNTSGYRNFPLG